MEHTTRLIGGEDVRCLLGFGANDNIVTVEDEDRISFHEVDLGHGGAVPFRLARFFCGGLFGPHDDAAKYYEPVCVLLVLAVG